MHAVIPLKGFDDAKGRLAPALGSERRSALARATAQHVAGACIDGGFETSVVTMDAQVEDWAGAHGAAVIPDPGRGLDAACEEGVASLDEPWVVVHGDLPLLDADTMLRVRALLADGKPVIAPSRDGGTNLIGSSGLASFAYGPGSFHRHLALLLQVPVVLVEIETLVELDTPSDIAAAAALPGGDWLAPFLT